MLVRFSSHHVVLLAPAPASSHHLCVHRFIPSSICSFVRRRLHDLLLHPSENQALCVNALLLLFRLFVLLLQLFLFIEMFCVCVCVSISAILHSEM